MSSLWEVIEVDTTVLEQYVELKEEIKDLHNRIDRDRRRLVKIESEGVVSDTVKGTRKDGTFGSFYSRRYDVQNWRLCPVAG